jgi:hypothetical protein
MMPFFSFMRVSIIYERHLKILIAINENTLYKTIKH